MMSYFPARDVEEPATKESVRAEIAQLRAEMSSIESRIIRWNIATMLVLVGLVVAAVRI